jgi:hypothetical protein
VAATVRTIVLLSNNMPWTLRNQAEAAACIRRGLLRLQPRHQCQCGEQINGLQAIKADAGAFFKSVDKHRCIQNVQRQIQALEQEGFAGVLLHKDDKTRNKLYRVGMFIGDLYRLVPFALVSTTLQFVEAEALVRMGSCILERVSGLAMGASMSPILCCTDFDGAIAKLRGSAEMQRRCGLRIPKK